MNVFNNLPCLVVNGSKGRFLPQKEAVNSGGNDMELVFQDIDQREEYLI